MTTLGSTLRLKFILTDNWGERVLYEEPFTYDPKRYDNTESYIDAFRAGVEDALKDLRRDYQYRATLADIPTAALTSELRYRARNGE